MTFLDYAARGKNSFWRYLVAWPLGVALFLLLVTGVLIPLMLLHWLPATLVTDLQSAAHPVTFYIGDVLLSFGGLLLGFMAAIYLLHRKSPADILGRWSWPQFARGAGLWLLFVVVVALIDFGLQPGGYRLTVNSLTPTILAVALPGLAVQTLAEEFVFRGYLTQGLLLWLKRPWLVSVLSGLVFGAMHISNSPASAVAATAFGIVMSMIAIRSGGLAIGYGIHLVNNLFAALVVVSEDDVFKGLPAVWTQKAPNLVWSDAAMELVALLIVLWLALGTSWLIRPTPADKYPK